MERRKKIGVTIRILSNQIGRKANDRISSNISTDVTGLQGRVIGFIKEQSKLNDVFQKNVENEFDLRRSTATAMLKLMEKNGLLTREAALDDARLKKIILTEKALDIRAQIMSEIDSVEKQLMEGLTEDEINTFFSVTEKMLNNIK